MGNKIRISVQLINVANGYQLWSERYDREMEDVFAIQDEIAQNIVKALRVVLSEDEKRAIEKMPTENVEAYDYYLRGRTVFPSAPPHEHRGRPADVHARNRDRSRVCARARGYRRLLLDSLHVLRCARVEPQAGGQREPESARSSIPISPKRIRRAGLSYSLSKQYDLAMKEFETAMKLDPKLYEAPYFYGRACLAQGKWFEAAPLFEKAAATPARGLSGAELSRSGVCGAGTNPRSEQGVAQSRQA